MTDKKKVPDPQIVAYNREDIASLLELDPETCDPNVNYRFVKDEPLRIARHKMKKYKFILQSEGVRTLAESEDRGDGFIRVGDAILMGCPKEAFEARQLGNRTFSERRLTAPKMKVQENARKKGVRTFESEEEL